MNATSTAKLQAVTPQSLITPTSTGFNSQVEQVQAYLSESYEFKHNAITNRVLVRPANSTEDFHYLDEYEFNSILRAIKLQNIGCSKDTLRMILYSDFVPSYDMYKSYIDKLPVWDGHDYLGDLAKSVQTTQPEHFDSCLRKWMVGLVASLYDDKVINHTAIILSGPQGIGKTSWFHSFLPADFQEYIHEGYVHTKDKETNVKISECVLILMDELENLSDKSLDAVKQLMTQTGVSMRRAYTTISQFYPRRASFAGTVNKKQFLRDLTGNRRFLCFEVEKINLKHGIPTDQLFAQIKHLYLTGFQYWFNEDEISKLNEMNAEFRDISIEEEAFSNNFDISDINDPDHAFMTTTEIIEKLIQRTGSARLSVQRLGHVLADMKVPRVKKNGRYGYTIREKI